MPPRTPSARVSSWVIWLVPEVEFAVRIVSGSKKSTWLLFDDTGLLKIVYSCVHRMHRTELRFDWILMKADSG